MPSDSGFSCSYEKGAGTMVLRAWDSLDVGVKGNLERYSEALGFPGPAAIRASASLLASFSA